MSRKSSSSVVNAVGERVVTEVWGCFDEHAAEYGKPDEDVNFMRKVNVSSVDGKVLLRFGESEANNKVFSFSGNATPNIDIAVICLDDDEVIMTYEEAKSIFSAFGF